ncbi:MAG: transposase, partial [Catenulispora sp.]
AVRDYIQPRRSAARTAPASTPGVRKVTGWIMTAPDRLEETDAVALKAIRVRCAELNSLVGYVRRFASMVADLDGHLLDTWIITTQISGLPPLASFARGLLADYDAVHNGLSLPFSSGACEGNVNRIKMIKRQMYGRANLDLLRARVIHDH